MAIIVYILPSPWCITLYEDSYIPPVHVHHVYFQPHHDYNLVNSQFS